MPNQYKEPVWEMIQTTFINLNWIKKLQLLSFQSSILSRFDGGREL
jgi:hypothetical protein